jgi:predicted  nucleic acid-binding Zn ribbon protein
MYTAEVRFRAAGAAEAELADGIHHLLACWLKNGQILDGWLTAEQEDGLLAFVSTPAEDSLLDTFANRYVRKLTERVTEYGGPPEVRLLGMESESRPACECKSSPAFVLFTTYLGRESPLRCGDCFNPVPLYRIPYIHDEEYSEVLKWEADYKACDTLQMHIETGERFGERQMGRHDSSLSRRGRELCTSISSLTGRPTYYYVHKFRARSSLEEDQRRCPDCGGEWKLGERWHLFDFKCDSCLLLSAIASSLHR